MTPPARPTLRVACRLRTALRDEGGFATPLGLIWIILLLVIGGMAVDMTNAWRNRAMLQITADAAAHAAAQILPQPGKPVTKDDRAAMVAEAVRIARLNMPPSTYGEVVTASSVEIGSWDNDTHIFDTESEFPDAVRVYAKRVRANGNEVATMLLRLGVLESWDVGARAMVQRFLPRCTRDGIISAQYAELTSGNEILAPFCLHGETGVGMSNSNSFELGTIVSMPDFADLDLPTAGYESNPGLKEALSQEHLYPRMTKKIDLLFEELQDIRSPYQPDYILYGYGHKEVLSNTEFNPANLQPGNIYVVECGAVSGPLADNKSNKTIKFESDAHVEKNVIVTNCAVMLNAGAFIGDALILTSNEGSQSIGGNSGATVGAPDNCSPGGGAGLYSMGDVVFPSDAEFQDVQIVARGSVHIAAAPGGIKGIQVQAQGEVKLTASGGFALCPNRDDPPYQADFYRIVM